MVRNGRLFGAVIVASLVSFSACDNKTTAPTPTPTPAPTPAPTPTPPPAPAPPPAAAALESITLSASEVPSQGEPTLTIKLTAAAPSGNASISLQSSHDTVVRVPSNVSIAAGETSTSLKLSTPTVNAKTTVTITASYQGVTMSATLTILAPPLEPRFTVTSNLGSDACSIINVRGEFDCVLDASSSSGFVATYHWTITAGSADLKVDRADGGPFTPAAECAFLAGGSQNDGKVSMTVTLRLEDRQGNFSSNERHTVTLVTNHFCGY